MECGLSNAWISPDAEIPVWLEAREVGPSFATAVQEALGRDPARSCRIVVDNLDAVSPQRADQLLDDARRLALTWPRASVLATTRPGAGHVDDEERISVAPWPVQRGIDLFHVVAGEEGFSALHVPETRQLLTSPLQVHALATRVRAGGDARVSTHELLSGLAHAILQREHPNASADVWTALTRLAANILDAQGPVRAAAFGRQPVIWDLEQTGLVVHEAGLLRFALPLFEQHFGAQALQDGEAQIESAAGADSFPKWRYAIAFAMTTSTAEDAEQFMCRLSRTNPAAASWVLDETAERASATTNARDAADAAQQAMASLSFIPQARDHESDPALVVARWLREAQLSWLDGLGASGQLLAPHHDGKLTPWGVWLDNGWMSVAEAREGTLDADLVVTADSRPAADRQPQWRSRQAFVVPYASLGRWRWARERLRRPLLRHVRRRTLPVPPGSPLAAERMWFLARRVMNDGMPRRVEEIPVSDLRSKVESMLAQVERSVWSTWQWPSYTADSADIRWLHAQLQREHGDTISSPRPFPDRAAQASGFYWQMYSPELTRSIAAGVLKDAIRGYQELVEHNFPRFGSALGLYSILPARVEGTVIMPRPDDEDALSAFLCYTMLPANSSAKSDSTIDLDLAEEPDIPDSFQSYQQQDNSSVFHLAEVDQEELSTHLDRQATNFAYSWLARDLRTVGWLTEGIYFHD